MDEGRKILATSGLTIVGVITLLGGSQLSHDVLLFVRCSGTYATMRPSMQAPARPTAWSEFPRPVKPWLGGLSSLGWLGGLSSLGWGEGRRYGNAS